MAAPKTLGRSSKEANQKLAQKKLTQRFDAIDSLTFDRQITCGILIQRLFQISANSDQRCLLRQSAEVAQLVEQRTENPCVRSSILRLGTIFQSNNRRG